MSYDNFSALDALLNSATTTDLDIESPATNTDAIKRPSLPSANSITLVTANYYNNGPKEKLRWDSAQHAMNIQFFTKTTPFTPTYSDVAWSGAVQLQPLDYFDRKLYAMMQDDPENMTGAQYERYREIIRETIGMPRLGDGPLLGVFVTKSPGTCYHYYTCMRVTWNDLDEMICEIFLEDDTKITIRDFSTVKKRNGVRDPDMRGRHDPLNLWVAKKKGGRA
jgi:hypothetical protein